MTIVGVCLLVNAVAEWTGAQGVSSAFLILAALIALGALSVGALALCVAVVCAIAAPFSRPQPALTMGAAATARNAAIVFFSAVAIIWSGSAVRSATFGRVAGRAEPLIAAIRSFEADRGELPAKLSDLVPDWIESVPTTGLISNPAYEFVPVADRDGVPGDTWGLQFHCGSLGWDTFVFYADGNYDGVGPRFGGSAEPVRDWVYVHE